jgi:hypothetical protein
MPDKFGSGKGSNKTTTDLHKGLSNKAAKFPDKSFKHPGGSVNNDTTRSSTAKTPKTLGPRSA